MLNVSGKDHTLRHDTQIGVAILCQTDYVSLMMETDKDCETIRIPPLMPKRTIRIP